MAKLKLTIACDSYDYLLPLREGRVQAEGVDLNLLTVESGIRHERFYRHGEYDACEFSMCSYLVARGQGIDWFQAIPFFTRRMFGHKFCFVRAGSDLYVSDRNLDIARRYGLIRNEEHPHGGFYYRSLWILNREAVVTHKSVPWRANVQVEEYQRLFKLIGSELGEWRATCGLRQTEKAHAG